MRDTTTELHFLAQSVDHRGIARMTQPDRLDRNLLTQLEVLGLVHLAHAASSKQADDTESTEQQGSRLKADAIVTVRLVGEAARRIGVGRQDHRRDAADGAAASSLS